MVTNSRKGTSWSFGWVSFFRRPLVIQMWVCLAQYGLRNKPIRAGAAQHGCCPNNLTYTQYVHQVYLDFRVGGREEHLVATWDLSAAGCFLYIMTADIAMSSEINVSMYICSWFYSFRQAFTQYRNVGLISKLIHTDQHIKSQKWLHITTLRLELHAFAWV